MDIVATDRVGPVGILSAEEVEEINAGLSHNEDNQASCIDALQIVQKHRGWVADDSLLAIADYLKISPAEVEGVASFYNLIYRQPVGKHVVRICDSVSCWIMGDRRWASENLFERDRKREAALAKRHRDQRF